MGHKAYGIIRNAVTCTPVACVLLALSGCDKPYQKAFVGERPTILVASENPQDWPTIMVRYISAIDPASEPRLTAKYSTKQLWSGPNISPGGSTGLLPYALLAGTAKSNVYAYQFAQQIKDSLGRVIVIVQPMTMRIEKSGLAVATPYFDAPPVELIFDFFKYQSPDVVLSDVSNALANGLVHPLISLRTDPAAAPATHGALMVHAALVPLMDRGVAHDGKGAELGYGANIVELINAAIPENDVLAAAPWSEVAIVQRPLQIGHFIQYEFAFRRTEFERDSYDAGAHVFKPFINVAGDAVNLIDRELALKNGYKSYAMHFDKDLAARWTAADSESEARRALIKKFRYAEVQFLQHQTAALKRYYTEGEFREDIRNLQRAETKSVMTNLVVSSVAGSLATQASGGNVWAGAQAQMHNSQTHAVDFSNRMFSARESVNLAINFSGESENISASSLSELREKMKGLYKRTYPKTKF